MEQKAIGLLETRATVAAIAGLDAMLKAADVHLIHTEKRLGGGLVTVVVDGTISDVTAAVEAGREAAAQVGKVYLYDVVANPHPEITQFLYVG